MKINNCIAEANLKRGLMAVEIKSKHGIGAKLEWVLEILAFCEENALSPQFKFTNPDSNDDENYFESFFRINSHYKQDDPTEFIEIRSIHDLGLDKNYDTILNIELASYLIDKYLIVKVDVMCEVDEFCAQYFSNKSILGVHYRGTDKKREAPPVTYEMVERNINFYLDKFPKTDSVFVASDDENFITFGGCKSNCVTAMG